MPTHEVLQPHPTCLKTRKWNARVAGDGSGFHMDNLRRHFIAIVSCTRDVLRKFLLKFWKLAWLPVESFSGSVCCSELSFLVAPLAHTLLGHIKFASMCLLAVLFSVSHDFQLESRSVCGQILPYRQQGT